MERPSLPLHLTFIHEIFQTLSRSRGVSMGGVPPLVLSEIRAELTESQVLDLDFRRYCTGLIQAADQRWISKVLELAKKDKDSKR